MKPLIHNLIRDGIGAPLVIAGVALGIVPALVFMVGGKDKTRIRNATPNEFRDLLLSIAASARQSEAA